jgi:antitoxin HigA-1
MMTSWQVDRCPAWRYKSFANKRTKDFHERGTSEHMSIPNRRIRKRRPTHPGVMLREDFLPEYGLTVSGFAKLLRISRQTVNELLQERRALSPEMALRLSKLFGNTAEFWLNAQRAVDLWEAERSMKGKIQHISPLTAA